MWFVAAYRDASARLPGAEGAEPEVVAAARKPRSCLLRFMTGAADLAATMDAAWSSPAVWRRSASDAQQPAIAARAAPPTAAHGVTFGPAAGSGAAAGVATSCHNGIAPDGAHCMPERDVNTPSYSGGPRPPDDAPATTAEPLHALTEPAAQLHSPANRSYGIQRSPAEGTPQPTLPLPRGIAASACTAEEAARVDAEAHAASSVASSPSTSLEPQPSVWQRGAAEAAGSAIQIVTQAAEPVAASPAAPMPANMAESGARVDAADVRPAAANDDAPASVRYLM